MFREAVMGMTITLVLGFPVRSPAADEAVTAHLLPSQMDRIKSRFAEFRVFRLCPGRYGGLSEHDAVVGIVLPKGKVHRLGLVWDGSQWVLHDVGTELKQDRHLSHYLPMRWNFSVAGDAAQDFRCGFQLGRDERIGTEGDVPLFDLKQAGLERSTAVCFETDKTYNNWDCMVYSPKDKRFKLWFQQAHAD